MNVETNLERGRTPKKARGLRLSRAGSNANAMLMKSG